MSISFWTAGCALSRICGFGFASATLSPAGLTSAKKKYSENPAESCGHRLGLDGFAIFGKNLR